ncbi:hypothetical protein [Enterococcus sp. LJL51]|uniref:hypothetical protein n=1 Tax=Enterococcus sp. LJL51 TaxID=3416656 RepID=UPI003CF5C7A6
MRYVKTVHLKEVTSAYQYFYKKNVKPFRKLSANPVFIDDIVYNIWTFNSRSTRDYITAFPIEQADHFHIFELTIEEKVTKYFFKKVNKLSDFSTKEIKRDTTLTELKKIMEEAKND